jgi:hypothetical protein
MKKFLPIILLVLGIGIVAAVYFLVIRKPSDAVTEEEETLVVLPLNQRPIASLTPSADGHWLKLRIEKLNTSAASVEYELLYDLPDGRTQGVPGTLKLTGQSLIERDLLLGSESSGKFRYDVGVKKGTLTVRFRNESGKLVNKYTTKFALLSDTKDLISIDEKFSYTLAKASSKDFFVVMDTFGVATEIPAELVSGPIGVFSSAKTAISGVVKMDGATIYKESSSEWTKLDSGKSSNTGIFVGTN